MKMNYCNIIIHDDFQMNQQRIFLFIESLRWWTQSNSNQLDYRSEEGFFSPPLLMFPSSERSDEVWMQVLTTCRCSLRGPPTTRLPSFRSIFYLLQWLPLAVRKVNDTMRLATLCACLLVRISH